MPVLRLLAAVLILAVSAGEVRAETRVALVIGNSAYEAVPVLRNPRNDAADLADALEGLGFAVTRAFDLGAREKRLALRDFSRAASEADMALIYYAGHGMEIDNQNYLIPVDARLERLSDVPFEALELEMLLQAVQGAKTLKLVLLDACRNNPFLPQIAEARSRSLGQGLARVEPAGGVLVGYAAKGGTIAYDGEGRNSPYAAALLRHIREPGVEVGQFFRRVRDTVYRETGGLQEPFTYGSLPATEIYLAAPPAPGGTAEADPERLAALAWEDFRTSRSPEALEAFAETHAGTAYAALALEAAARLRRPGAAEAPTPALPADLPDWCGAPANAAQGLICRDPELLDLDAEVAELSARRLDVVRGAERGQALVEAREWRLARDACGEDRACIETSYRLRRVALSEFGDGPPPVALVVRSVQEELNRLSCGAGTPDGVAGSQTRAAYRLAASLSSGLEPEADLGDRRTLERLRALPTGLCSAIARAQERPALLEGRWRVDHQCPGENRSSITFVLTLRHDGDGVYSGTIASGGWVRALGGRATRDALNLAHRTETGFLQSFLFSPADAPFVLEGINWNRCELVARKQ